jgi:sterol 3beta-glucosyltransferase
VKVLILTLDTRGDVQPFVALPRGLANAGHEAVLAAPHRFEGFVRDQGVPFAGIDDCWSVAAEGPGAGADILMHNGQVVVGQHVAEKLGIPAVLALPIPMYVPTREFPWAGIAIPRWWPSALNRATFLGVKGPAMMFGRTVDRWRDVGPVATPWPA